MLNYFFRGSLLARTVGTGEIAITNLSGEDMNGTFSLYYDDAIGTRNPVPGATWQLTIANGQDSVPQNFTPPTSPVAQTPGSTLSFFKGPSAQRAAL
jgi:hypothetical protein